MSDGRPGGPHPVGRFVFAALPGALGWAMVAALLACLVVLGGLRLLGGGVWAVVSNSMAGSVETGDLVLALPQRADRIEVGEIVVFADPEGSGRLFQHRVQRVERKGDEIEFLTMGDANSGYERWSVPREGSVGRVASVISGAGYIFGPITDPLTRGLAGAAAWTALLGYSLHLLRAKPVEGHLASRVENTGNEFAAAADFGDPDPGP